MLWLNILAVIIPLKTDTWMVNRFTTHIKWKKPIHWAGVRVSAREPLIIIQFRISVILWMLVVTSISIELPNLSVGVWELRWHFACVHGMDGGKRWNTPARTWAIWISNLRPFHGDLSWTRGNFKWTRGNFQNTVQCYQNIRIRHKEADFVWYNYYESK